MKKISLFLLLTIGIVSLGIIVTPKVKAAGSPYVSFSSSIDTSIYNDDDLAGKVFSTNIYIENNVVDDAFLGIDSLALHIHYENSLFTYLDAIYTELDGIQGAVEMSTVSVRPVSTYPGDIDIIAKHNTLIKEKRFTFITLIFRIQTNIFDNLEEGNAKFVELSISDDSLVGSLGVDSPIGLLQTFTYTIFNSKRTDLFGKDSFAGFLDFGGFVNFLVVGSIIGAITLLVVFIIYLIMLFVNPSANVKSKKEFESQLVLIKNRAINTDIPIPTADRFSLYGIPNLALLPVSKEKVQPRVSITSFVQSVTLLTDGTTSTQNKQIFSTSQAVQPAAPQEKGRRKD